MKTGQVAGPRNFPDHDQWFLVQIEGAVHAPKCKVSKHGPAVTTITWERAGFLIREPGSGLWRLSFGVAVNILSCGRGDAHEGKQIQHDPACHKKPSQRYKSNERQRMVPKKTERLHQQSQGDKTSGEAQSGVDRVGLSQHHCTGFQNFTWFSSFTLWMVSWHPEVKQESLLLLISAIV